MKTTLDIEDIVYDYLKGTTLPGSITGVVKKHNRPANSSLEDVIITTLSTNNLQLQSAIVNINIHVPNLSIKKGGKVVDDGEPNHPRLKELARLAMDLLVNQWGTDWTFDVQQQQTVEDPVSKSHFINIRLIFYSPNILN